MEKPERLNTEYVEKRDDGYWVSGSRISLASIVYAFLNGQTAESIAQSFPTLSLEQVYGAITYYLAHRSEVDAYLREVDLAYEAQRAAERAADPRFYRTLADAASIGREPPFSSRRGSQRDHRPGDPPPRTGHRFSNRHCG
jgi:hypothetical protein